MKKVLVLLVVFAFVSGGSSIFINPEAAQATKLLAPGTVFKGRGLSTIYFLGDDNKRYVFPNAQTYFSWFDDFSQVEEVDDDELYDYPLGGNVRYKPGALMVKIQTDPKVYAVGDNGRLRWIKTERIARSLYGADWNLLIDDVPDSFFTNYEVGDPIEDEDGYDPEEEEEEVPTVNHNRGFRARLQAKIQASAQERRCRRLQSFIERVQKRLARWGIEADELGGDYLDECFDDSDSGQDQSHKRWRWWRNNKVKICHIPPGDPSAAHTIMVSRKAARAHLAHGDYLGECDGSGSDDDDDEPSDDEDKTAPVISDVGVDESVTTAAVSWTTDEDADSRVEYAAEPLAEAETIFAVDDSSLATGHELVLTGLAATTTYYYRVRSEDAYGNAATSSELMFTTGEEEQEEDTTAPVISGVSVEASTTYAVINWQTDEAADSKVVYADESLAAAASPSDHSDSTLVTSHSLMIENLATGTEYFFRIESADADSNLATTTEDSFTTLE